MSRPSRRAAIASPQRVRGDIEFDDVSFSYPAGKGAALAAT